MSLGAESVSLAGSGLVFINTYDASVTPAYRAAIISAENALQRDFTNEVSVNVTFSLAPLNASYAAENLPTLMAVSYGAFTAALRANATTSNDLLAVNGLPGADPSNGAGFAIPYAEARILGLTTQGETTDDVVTLNSSLAWSFGQDAIGAIEHELTEGVFGRISSLGVKRPTWSPMDLFRFTAGGARDYSGGADGVTTYFGVDAAHVTSFAYHNSVNALGVSDGMDLADWAHAPGDAFGGGGPAAPGSLSATDVEVVDVLGWNATPFTPGGDDYANGLTDASHPFGAVAPGQRAIGILQQAGDHDWFQVSLQAGQTYAFQLAGVTGTGSPALGGPLLQIHDAAGAVVLSDTVAPLQANRSELVFTAPTSGTYYLDAGGDLDGYAGAYGLRMTEAGTSPDNTGSFLVAHPGGDSLTGGEGADTMAGDTGQSTLYGGDGADWIYGGPDHNIINGNKGDDVIVGQSTAGDWISGGQGADIIDDARSAGPNIVNGNLGNDTIIGGSGGEILRGGQGDDQVRGGAGADWISGDLGDNTLSGGAGPDIFHPGGGHDTVLDFSAAQGDRVEVDPGVRYALAQSGANVIITLSDGGVMTLKSVQLSALPSGWIFQP